MEVTFEREMYTEVSGARNRRDEETDLVILGATNVASSSSSIRTFDVLLEAEFLIVERFRCC